MLVTNKHKIVPEKKQNSNDCFESHSRDTTCTIKHATGLVSKVS